MKTVTESTPYDIRAEARSWYHRTLPGGMPMDWIHTAADQSLGEVQEDKHRLALAAVAAGLFWDGTLHLDGLGRGTDYRECVLCR